MTSEAKRLFAVVKPYNGETLTSIIARSAEENVHPRLVIFLQALGIKSKKPGYISFTQMNQAALLATRLGISSGEVAARMHPPAASEHTGCVDWYGTPIPRNFIDANVYRFSPTSLEHAPFQKALWMLRPLTFCAESMEMLSAVCSHCRHRQIWLYRSAMGLCEKCRAPLTTAKEKSVPSKLRNDAKNVALLVNPLASTRREALAHLPEPFCYWEGGEVFTAIVEMGALLNDRNSKGLVAKVRRGVFENFSVSDIVNGYRFIMGWPNSLEPLMPRWRDGEASRTLAKSIGPLSPFLRSNAVKGKLQPAISDQVRELLRNKIVWVEGSKTSTPKWMAHDGLIGKTDASIKYQVGKDTLARLRTVGPPASLAICARGRHFFDEKALAMSISLFRSGATAGECADVLGVPEYCIASLASRGLLDLVIDPDALKLANKVIFERSSLERLKSKLCGTLIHKINRGHKVSRVLLHRVHPDDWVDAVEKVVDGTLKRGSGGKGKKIAMAEFLVDSDSAKYFLDEISKRPLPDNVWVCTKDAGILLGLNGGAVGKAIKQGLLISDGRTFPRTMISLSSIAAFNEKYYLAAAVKERFEMDSRLFGQTMKQAGYSPIATINRLRVWVRRDVEAVFPALD
jgi:hypothetical protein